MKKVHCPHDKLFKSSLQFPKVAREFLELFLPAHIKERIDFNSITYCQTTFINSDLMLSQSDVLFEVKLDDKLAYIYILSEHESKIDPPIAFWVLQYKVAIWDYHIKKYGTKAGLPLPVIVPLIFYTGGGKYTAERQFYKLFGDESETMKDILNQPIHLINTDELSEELMTSHLYAGTMSFLMRKRFRTQLTKEVLKIINNFNLLEDCDHRRFLIELISYMFNIDNQHTKANELIDILKHKMSPSVGGEMMSLASKLIEEGELKGMAKGKVKVAKNMFEQNYDPIAVAKLTELPIGQVIAIQKDIKKESLIGINDESCE